MISPDLFWIPGSWRGRLAVAARPRGGDWLEDEISGLRAAGIDIIVSLLEDEEAVHLGLGDEPATARANGIRFVAFPIPDRGVPGSSGMAFSLLADIRRSLDEGKTVAIHCRQSIGRAGLIASAVLAASEISPDRAIEIVSSARRLSVPETPEQRLWLQRLPRELPVAAA